jgi:iron complex transport system substrate-binding protein
MIKKMSKYIVFFLIMLLLLTITAGCSTNSTSSTQKPDTRTITNIDGTPLVVPAEVKKVAAFDGFSYEKIVLLGAEDKIVMCGDYHQKIWPWALKIFKKVNNIPAMPQPSTPNMEVLQKAAPDVIFTFGNPEPLAKMKELGFAVVYQDDKSQHTIEANTKGVLAVYADALGGNAPEMAKKYNAYFDTKMKMVTDITAQIPENERPTVYFAIRSLFDTAGRQSLIPELVQKAGGNLVTRGLDIGYGKTINVEQLLAWNPQFIFFDHIGGRAQGSMPPREMMAQIAHDDIVQQLIAAKNNNIFFAPIGAFFWDTGLQIPLELMWMAKILHPDKFVNLDLNKEIKEFYATFFNYNLTDDEVERILTLQLPEGMKDPNAK